MDEAHSFLTCAACARVLVMVICVAIAGCLILTPQSEEE